MQEALTLESRSRAIPLPKAKVDPTPKATSAKAKPKAKAKAAVAPEDSEEPKNNRGSEPSESRDSKGACSKLERIDLVGGAATSG